MVIIFKEFPLQFSIDFGLNKKLIAVLHVQMFQFYNRIEYLEIFFKLPKWVGLLCSFMLHKQNKIAIEVK